MTGEFDEIEGAEDAASDIETGVEAPAEDTATEPGDGPKPKVISTHDAVREALQKAKDKDGTQQDPKSRKLPVQPDGKKPGAKAAGDENAAAPASDAQAAGQVKAPKNWEAGMHQEFAKLPPNVQKYILEREGVQEKILGRAGQAAEFGNKISKITQPYEAMFRAENTTSDGAVKELLNMAYIVRRGSPAQKAQLIADTMRQFGIDLRHLSQDPAKRPAPDINAQIQEGVQKAIRAQTEQQTTERFLGEVQTFAADTVNNPHYATLQPQILGLLRAGAATSLRDAYDQALRAHPTLHTTWVDKTLEQRTAELKKQNDARRRAGSSLSGSPGKPSMAQAAKKVGRTTEDDIRIALAEVRDGG